MKVSVIIPYNKDRGYLNRCVSAVIDQQYKDCQAVPYYGDQSLGRNFNAALKIADGEYIILCAEDDYLLPNAVGDLLSGMGGYDLVCANAYITYPSGDEVEYRSRPPRNHIDLIAQNTIHGGTVMYRREVIDAVGGMSESMWTGEEYDMNVRIMKAGYKCGYVDSFVQVNNVWPGSKSQIMMRETKTKQDRRRYITGIIEGHLR